MNIFYCWLNPFFIPGGIRPQDQLINKVSVIGGGDLGMASVMSILAKVNHHFLLYFRYFNRYYAFKIIIKKKSNSNVLVLMFFLSLSM